MSEFVILGSGPSDISNLSIGVLRELESAQVVILRTAIHPAMSDVITTALAAGAVVLSCDPLYEIHSDFTVLYEEIGRLVESFVLEKSKRRAIASVFANLGGDDQGLEHADKIAYVTPGSPIVAEETVDILTRRLGTRATVVPAISFIDLALSELRVDPFRSSVTLVDASEFMKDSFKYQGNLLISQVWSDIVAHQLLDVFIEANDFPNLKYLYHLGLSDQVICSILPREFRDMSFDHLTSLYVEDFQGSDAWAFSELVDVVAQLREDCPWDKKQTHSSLGKHLIEEAYEVIDAIDRFEAEIALGRSVEDQDEPVDGNVQLFADEFAYELGDLLVQVLFHSVIAKESGTFTLSFVLNQIREKLIRRHPHVFDGLVVDGVDEVLSNWENIKRGEKSTREPAEGVPSALPALLYGAKIIRKADAFGYIAPTREHLVLELKNCIDELCESPNLLANLVFMAIRLSKLDSIDLESDVKTVVKEFSLAYAEEVSNDKFKHE